MHEIKVFLSNTDKDNLDTKELIHTNDYFTVRV